MRRKLAAGNWKMNGLSRDLDQITVLAAAFPDPGCDVVICPPAPLLYRAASVSGGTPIAIGAQDCHRAETGAHTGDISANMITDAGASYVIVGHSERRADHDESDSDIRAKARTAIAAGLTAIVCMGESLEEREAANTLDIIAGQLSGSLPDDADATSLVIAYEPVWAIGTGKVATLDQITEVHDFIRARLVRRYGPETGNAVRILYGGSVKPDNAQAIFSVENVDGALVGGASLKAADFGPIITALENS